MKRTLLHAFLLEDENSSFSQSSLSGEFSTGRYEIHTVRRSADGVDALLERRYDACVVEDHTSSGQGIALIRDARAAGVDTPIIALGEENWEAMDLDVIQSGAADYLSCEDVSRGLLDRSIRYALLRRAAEEATRTSERRLRALVEHSSDAKAIVLPGGVAVYGSPAVHRLFGYASEEFEGMNVLSLVHPDDRPRAARMMARLARRRGSSHTVQHRIRRRDGVWRWAEGVLTNLLHEPGIGGIVCNYRDITERKSAEEALQSSEARFQTLAHSGVVGIVEGDLQGAVHAANRTFLEMVGYSEEEVAEGRLRWDALTPPGYEEQTAWTRQLLAERGVAGPYRKEYLRKDGRRVPVLLVSTLSDRRRGRGIAFVIDLTSQVKAEEELRRSEQRYRRLFENANDIIYTLDLSGAITSLNRAGERLLQFSREELLGTPLLNLVTAETRTRIAESVADQGTFEMDVIARNGERLTLEVSSQTVSEDNRPVAVQAIARDVTERKNLEAQLRQAQKMEAIGRLAGGVAHDFNNLLTVILGTAELYLSTMKEDDPVRPGFDEITEAGSRAADLTRQLLAFSRTQVLRPAAVNVSEAITAASKILRRLIGEHIELITDLPANLPLIRIDPGQLDQAIINLAINARDAMPRGGRLVVATRLIVVDDADSRLHGGVAAGPHVVVTVSDTGCGMSPETKSRIFEPFFTTKESGKGTGLGLPMVYGIVKQSGGNILVDTELDAGTTFKLYFPVDQEQAAPAQRKAGRAATARGSETILLVEDERIVREFTQEALRRCGYRVLQAATPAEALNLAGETAIDLLLTDLVMPGMSGQELAERMTSPDKGLRVLFMSGYTDDAVAVREIFETNAPFLQKPFTPRELAEKVREVLDTADHLQPAESAGDSSST